MSRKVNIEKRLKVLKLHHEEMTVEIIAERLNLEESTVEAIVKRDSEDPLNYNTIDPQDKKQIMLRKLKNSSYWNSLIEQFNRAELDLFVNSFCDMLGQFGDDVLYAEELQVKTFITLEIMAGRSLKERSSYIRSAEMYENTILSLEKKRSLTDTQQAELELARIELTEANHRANDCNKTYLALISESAKGLAKLKATREQRVQNGSSPTENWAKLVQLIGMQSYRDNVSRDLEIRRLAKEKALAEYSRPHKFADGEIDQPILTSENVI